jgi:hypothetical protein
MVAEISMGALGLTILSVRIQLAMSDPVALEAIVDELRSAIRTA